MPISHPSVYSVYLAKKQGPFATLGLAEDTWALNERVIDEKAFFEQAMADLRGARAHVPRRARRRRRRASSPTVFDTTDRVQHMFYRYLDPTHPANAGKDTERVRRRDPDGLRAHGRAARPRLRATLGATGHGVHGDQRPRLHQLPPRREPEHLAAGQRLPGAEGRRTTTSGDWFEHVDWTRTRAFTLGLTGLFINRKGRETQRHRRRGRRVPARWSRRSRRSSRRWSIRRRALRCIRKVRATAITSTGPTGCDAPDLLIGYEGGYRNSWDCATGAVTASTSSPTTPRAGPAITASTRDIVPGVFFCNRRIATERPRLIDIPLSIVELFGQKRARYMQGEMIFAAERRRGRRASTRRSLDQSGCRARRARRTRAGRRVRRPRRGADPADARDPAPARSRARRRPDRPGLFVLGVDGMDPGDPRPPDRAGAHAQLRGARARGQLPAARHVEPAAEPGRLVELRHRPRSRRPRHLRLRPPRSAPLHADLVVHAAGRGSRHGARLLRLADPARRVPSCGTTAAARPGGTCWWRTASTPRCTGCRATTRCRAARRRCSRAWARWTCAAATARTRCCRTAPIEADDPKGDIQRVSVQDFDLDGTPDTVEATLKGPPDCST